MAVKAKSTIKLVQCRSCQYSHLMRYSKNDPILAECTTRKELMIKQDGTSKYAHPVEVACIPKTCELYAKAKSIKPIELRKKIR